MSRMPSDSQSFFMSSGELQYLLDQLVTQGYECLGPKPVDGAIQYLPIASTDDLSPGITLESTPGHYRLLEGKTHRLFSWANGPQGLKPMLFSPRESLWSSEKDHQGRIEFKPSKPAVRPRAVIGVRACDLAALKLQDQHFLSPPADPHYQARREGLFIVGVDCTHPAETCFCAATGDGPALRDGFDIGLSELDEGFLLCAGSDRGAELLERMSLKMADPALCQKAGDEIQAAAEIQTRRMPGDVGSRLPHRLESGHWKEVEQRCLACGNCTAVCPTCFCYSASSEPALDGRGAVEVREWDSCFNPGHSSMHGHPVRGDRASRYRQWLTHKFSGWHQQYGRSGCVGCGRCIAWCPVGIDVTVELKRLLEEEAHE